MLNEVQATRLIIGLIGIVLIIIAPSLLVYYWKKKHDPFRGVFFTVGSLLFGMGFFITFLTWGY